MKNIAQFTLTVGKNISGGSLDIIGYTYSNGNGPSVYIQGGTHGGEVTFPIFSLLDDFFKKNNDWQGTVTMIPLAHPVSWTQRLYYNTLGKFNFSDGKDWNRSFPGNPEGSLSERISHLLFNEAIKHNLVIDLHTSRKSNPFLIISREDLLPLCLASGIQPTYVAPKFSSGHPLPDAIDIAGGRGLTIECGSHDTINPKHTDQCFSAIVSILQTEGILPQNNTQPVLSEDAYYYTDYVTYHAPISGFVEYTHPLESVVKQGDVLYVIHDSSNLGEVVSVKAKADCVVFKYQTTHAVTLGDEVVTVINADEIKKPHA
jgi:predicted deacylase